MYLIFRIQITRSTFHSLCSWFPVLSSSAVLAPPVRRAQPGVWDMLWENEELPSDPLRLALRHTAPLRVGQLRHQVLHLQWREEHHLPRVGQVRADKLQILSPSTFALPSNIMIMTEIENEKEDIFTNNICPFPSLPPSLLQNNQFIVTRSTYLNLETNLTQCVKWIWSCWLITTFSETVW